MFSAIGIAAWLAGPAILIGAAWKLRRKKKHFVEVKCDECFGTGEVWRPHGMSKDRVGRPDMLTFWRPCEACGGKGFTREFVEE